jgi:acetyl esterase/lipase
MSEKVLLWNGEIPGYIEGADVPAIDYYEPKVFQSDAAVVIFAGGGYRHRASHEGAGYAKFLSENGISAFVVDYRVKPTTHPYPLLDARRAVRYVRANADKYRIDPKKIAVMGSSAGGHLAALVSTYKGVIDGEGADGLDEVDPMPNMQLLCYPVLDILGHSGSFFNLLGEKTQALHRLVTPYLIAEKDAPPMFLWHTAEDTSVDINSSFRYATRLHELGIPVELHIYKNGPHGLGLADGEKHDFPYVRGWERLLLRFLKANGYYEKEVLQ